MKGWLHHIDITVASLERTTGFYDLFADPDGIKLKYVYTPKWPTG